MNRRDLIKLFCIALPLSFSQKNYASNQVFAKVTGVSSDKNEKSNLVVVDYISDMLQLDGAFLGKTVLVKNYSSSLSLDKPVLFQVVNASDDLTETGGDCFSGSKGVFFVMKSEKNYLNAGWFGTSDKNLKISELGSDSDKVVKDIILRYLDVDADEHDYFNNFTISAALKAAGKYKKVYLGDKKILFINKNISCFSCMNVDGGNSTLKTPSTIKKGTVLFNMGRQILSVKEEGIKLTRGSDKLALKNSSLLKKIKVGDLISFKSTEIRSGKQYKNVRPYFHGMRAIVVAIGADSITLDRKFYASFNVSEVVLNEGSRRTGLVNLNIDLSESLNVIPPVSGVSITGTNIDIDNVNVIGNEYCGAGILILGCASNVKNSSVRGFANVQGLPLPARVGYGIYVDCNDTIINKCYFQSNKHHVTCASRDYVMSNIHIINCTGKTTEKDIRYDVNASFDLHANVIGDILFDNLNIITKGPAFNIRNGLATVRGCTISSSRYEKITPALINVFDYEIVESIKFLENKVYSGDNVRLFHFGDIAKVSEISVINNHGTVSALFDKDFSNCDVRDITISGNKFNRMLFVMNLRFNKESDKINIESLLCDSNLFIQSAHADKNKDLAMFNFHSPKGKGINFGTMVIKNTNIFVKDVAIDMDGVIVHNNLLLNNNLIRSMSDLGLIKFKSSLLKSLSVNELNTNCALSLQINDSDQLGVKEFKLKNSSIPKLVIDLNEISSNSIMMNSIVSNNVIGFANTVPLTFKTSQHVSLTGFSVENNKFISLPRDGVFFEPRNVINNGVFEGNLYSTSSNIENNLFSLPSW